MLRLLLILLVLVGLVLVLFTRVDETPFQNEEFFRATMARLDSIEKVFDSQPDGRVRIGWGQASITPEAPVRLTGNHWTPYDTIYDPVYVRSFIFSNNHRKIALISYDLWILHPHFTEAITEKIRASELGITGIYFTATHTHTSVGGWGKGLLGNLVMGGNDDEMVNNLTQATIKSLQTADEEIRDAAIGFGSASTQNMVRNRLDKKGYVDDRLRLLKIQNVKGEQAIFTTFSAHSVYMDENLNGLSADYPGPLLNFINRLDSIEFASFAAGAVGSHSPVRSGPFAYENMVRYSKDLATVVAGVEDHISLDTTSILKFAQWPINFGSPHFRITDHWRVRPWLFHAVLGENQGYINSLRVGNTVLLGLPVELSGEFYPEFRAICLQKGISLMITSFNGNYLGYVNPEKYYYTIRKSETREMNWNGPQAGAYMVALIKELLAII